MPQVVRYSSRQLVVCFEDPSDLLFEEREADEEEEWFGSRRRVSFDVHRGKFRAFSEVFEECGPNEDELVFSYSKTISRAAENYGWPIPVKL